MWRTLVVCGVFACGGTSGGGDAGTGDDAAIDAAGTGPTSRDDLIRACILIDTCATGEGIQDCFTDLALQLPGEYLRCVAATSGDCVAVRACLRYSIVADATCSGRFCQGTDSIRCTGGQKVTYECGGPLTTGDMCIGAGRCGAGTCTGNARRCNGTIAEECDSDVLEAVDCADYGMECAAAICTDPGGGAACTPGAPPRCDGTAIIRCEGGAESRYDCAPRFPGASCQLTTGGVPAAYCGYGAACSPDHDTETCAGTSVTFCAAGETATVDCTSLGFTRCLLGGCFP